MKENIQEFERFEQIRKPEVARRAGDFIAAVETATPESPVSLDVLVEDGDLTEHLGASLGRVDEFYNRHAELNFFIDSMADGNLEGSFTRDFRGILDLSNQIIREVKTQGKVRRSASIGLATLQLADAGARLARDPPLAIIQNTEAICDIDRQIAAKSGELANASFHDSLASCIRGSQNAIPSPRIGYLGSLLDTHYAFWMAGTWGDLRTAARVPSEIFSEREKLLPRFPAKSRLYDIHSWLGRPSPESLREEYLRAMQLLEESLEDKAPEGHDLTVNTHQVTPVVFNVLDAATRKGWSPEDCLRRAVYDSVTIGRLSEHTATRSQLIRNQGVFRYDGHIHDAHLVIDAPSFAYKEILSEEIERKLQYRDEKGGTCPARDLIPLTKQGQTREKLLLFCDAVENRIGVYPPVFRVDERNPDSVYVDPAALLVNYILLWVANNYYES